jgi:hypothetical protein
LTFIFHQLLLFTIFIITIIKTTFYNIIINMSQQNQANRIIRLQNSLDFELDINTQPNIFKKGLLSKTLNPPQKDINISRTTTVKCLQLNCK